MMEQQSIHSLLSTNENIVKIGTLLMYLYLSLYIIDLEGILQSYLSNIDSQSGQAYVCFYQSSI